MPPIDHLLAVGTAVQQVLYRRGFGLPTQLRHHVALRDRVTGHVVVLPLPDGLAAPTPADLARQASREHARVSDLR